MIMAGEKFITLAIHTYDRAVALRKLLEGHGVEVRFEKLVISGTGIASGVRVKIEEHDLPLALKVSESAQTLLSPHIGINAPGEKRVVLIPVDFTSNSELACKVGFDLARRLDLHPVLLHACVTPYFSGTLAYDDPVDGVMDMPGPDGLAEMEAGIDIRRQADRRMRTLRRAIEESQKKGEMPDITFTTTLTEGVPEDVIKEYCRLTPPSLVVMATRGKAKKEMELIGSVTAEVLDSSRVPVFSIPENVALTAIEDIRELVYFCNLDQQDLITVDSLMRMFGYPEVKVTLIPVNDRAGQDSASKVEALRDYFNKSYPAAHFLSEVFPAKNFRERFEDFVREKGVQLLIVPNKRRNIFSRLFNPGIAHKLLFERDIPLLALPV